MELEDLYEDIVSKASKGLRSPRLEDYQNCGDEQSIREIALKLHLDANKLVASANGEWYPQRRQLQGLNSFESPFGEMSVNSYLTIDPSSRKALLFDTGTDSRSVFSCVDKENLEVESIFITHTHGDHVACLDQFVSRFQVPVYVHESEVFDGATPIREGFEHSIGGLSLTALHTHGHSVGGMTFLIKGLERMVAVTGDAIFAGSMGGGMVSYEDALRNNREKIMTLPDDTVLCPGHGPMTTVGEEKAHNPFFPEFQEG